MSKFPILAGWLLVANQLFLLFSIILVKIGSLFDELFLGGCTEIINEQFCKELAAIMLLAVHNVICGSKLGMEGVEWGSSRSTD